MYMRQLRRLNYYMGVKLADLENVTQKLEGVAMEMFTRSVMISRMERIIHWRRETNNGNKESITEDVEHKTTDILWTSGKNKWGEVAKKMIKWIPHGYWQLGK